jgi:chromosome segregation ATPase
MEKKVLPYLVVISAISVSLSAAFYSVTGVGKMFAGSSTNVMIMMASLEIAKLVLASLLFQYWDRLNVALKSYYFIAIFTLMVITSGGIYGYLSAAYSETSTKLQKIEKNVEVLEIKRNMFQTRLDDTRKSKDLITESINDLTNALSNNVIQYTDKDGNVITTQSSKQRAAVQEQITLAQEERNKLTQIELSMNDSIQKIDLKILDLETNDDVAAEIGPLKYIANLTGKSIDKVVNWFIIALMLVFDPLAVSLVVGANVIFRDKEKEEEKRKLASNIDKKIEEFKNREKEFEEKSSQFNARLKEVEDVEKSLDNKLKEKEDLIKEKEKQLEEDIKLKEKELKEKLNDEKEDLEQKLIQAQNKLNNLKSEEDKIKKHLSEEEYRIAKMEDDLLKEKEELLREKKELEEDKKEFELEYSSLDDVRDELKQKEMEIEEAKEELIKLDKEIKDWESTHWRLRRGKKPPSAI